MKSPRSSNSTSRERATGSRPPPRAETRRFAQVLRRTAPDVRYFGLDSDGVLHRGRNSLSPYLAPAGELRVPSETLNGQLAARHEPDAPMIWNLASSAKPGL